MSADFSTRYGFRGSRHEAVVQEAPCAFISQLNRLEIRPDDQPNLTPDLLADLQSLFDESPAEQFPNLLKTCEPTAGLNPQNGSAYDDHASSYDGVDFESNYDAGNDYENVYSYKKRKKREADYWDYDYKLYDFDSYDPGCSLSYQQTQVHFMYFGSLL